MDADGATQTQKGWRGGDVCDKDAGVKVQEMESN